MPFGKIDDYYSYKNINVRSNRLAEAEVDFDFCI